jgi:aspartate/methionine/tyrosine aminotransferase
MNEHRMIAWRVGWVVAPSDLVNDASRVAIYSGLTTGGFDQIGAAKALEESDEDFGAAVAELQRRRDETMRQLDGLGAIPAAGGWSLIVDTRALGVEPADLSRHLLDQKVAATPMTGWGGDVAARHIRFVFSREPVERIALLGDRVRAALTAAQAQA